MMRALLMIVLFLTGALSCAAQLPSIKEDGPFQDSRPGNQWRQVVENHGSSSISAMLSIFHCPGSGGFKSVDSVRVYDPMFHYGTDRDVLPGESVEMNVEDPTRCPGGVAAAIFADGHTEGDPQTVKRLYAIRQGVYEVLGDTISLLHTVAGGSDNTQNVMRLIDERCQTVAHGKTIDSDERTAMVMIYSQLKAILSDPESVLRAPLHAAATPQPDIGEVVSTSKVSRDQARAIVMSRQLEEWRSALESNLGPAGGV